MKRIATIILSGALFLAIGCKKDNSNSLTTLPIEESDKIVNSDVQDAIADKMDQDIDKTLDNLQNNNYDASVSKSKANANSISIVVDHPDSTTFPKLITITYDNYVDSTGNESFVKNGQIKIAVTASESSKNLTTRVITFNDFSITTDSTTVTVNGTRTVNRESATISYSATNGLRLNIVDNIASTLKFKISIGSEVDSVTRIAAKKREAVLHYAKVNSYFIPVIAKDTIKYTGTVTGKNENGETYSKTVTNLSPLVITFYNRTPIISSGEMVITFGEGTNITSSYTLTFKASTTNKYKTEITVINNKTLKSYVFERKIGRKFKKYWK